MESRKSSVTEYLYQASPNSPVVKFSDKSLVVAGVRYYPKWPWSEQYRKDFRKTYGRHGLTET